jgi:hypothetical protein
MNCGRHNDLAAMQKSKIVTRAVDGNAIIDRVASVDPAVRIVQAEAS